MERKLFVVNNPTSGSRNKNQRTVREFRSFAESNKLPFQLIETTTEENAKSIVLSRFENSFTDLVIIGGDGTANEAVNGLKFDVPMSIISAGTGNDFLKVLPPRKTLEDQFKILVSGKTLRIDLGVCNGRKFLNGVGIGFDGQIVEEMLNTKVPLLKGHAKYYFHVLQILASYREKPFKFILNGENNQEDLILMTVGNGSTFGGGFNLMPEANIQDGLLEICTIGAIPGWKRFLHIGKLSNGSHGSLSAVNFYRTKSVQIDSPIKLFAHIDGEPMGNPPYTMEILPSALRVRM